jgi:hypothetical protein
MALPVLLKTNFTFKIIPWDTINHALANMSTKPALDIYYFLEQYSEAMKAALPKKQSEKDVFVELVAKIVDQYIEFNYR